LEFLSAAFNYSPLDLCFSDYLLAQRLEQAKKDLRNPAYDRLSIAEIGYRCGSHDLSSYYRISKVALTQHQDKFV
jgi:AraC-like DNA-binding protein